MEVSLVGAWFWLFFGVGRWFWFFVGWLGFLFCLKFYFLSTSNKFPQTEFPQYVLAISRSAVSLRFGLFFCAGVGTTHG